MRDEVVFRGERAIFSGVLRVPTMRHALSFLKNAERQHMRSFVLDFTAVDKAYPNTMLPLVAQCQRLRKKGLTSTALLPRSENAARLFLKTNWAHYLEPGKYDCSDDTHSTHLATTVFVDGDGQQACINAMLDKVLGSISIERSFLRGLEWCLSEITDNVINHAESSTGGFVQMSVYPDNNRVVFCVADTGKGILASLREGYPQLRCDRDAIFEAVRAGVTRNKDFGQGNGLCGTLEVAKQAGGRCEITSGTSSIVWADGQAREFSQKRSKEFEGTVVDVQLPVDVSLDVGDILSFGGQAYEPTDMIECKYLSDDEQQVDFVVRNESTGFGSRTTGRALRTKVKNLLAGEPNAIVAIDWSGVQMISSSFADEFVARLFVEMGAMRFNSRIRQRNIDASIIKLLDRAIQQRVHQEAEAWKENV